MSKLFNTLEQIRRQETYQVPIAKDTSGGNKKSGWHGKRSLGVLIITACAAILMYLSMPLVMQYIQSGVSVLPGGNTAVHKPATTSASRAGNNREPSGNPTASEITGEGKFLSLLDQGADHVRNFDHWKGIYFFDQARKLSPQRVEPLINIGVALAELGLNELAVRYLKQAAEMNPDHPMLQANLEALANAGIGKLEN